MTSNLKDKLNWKNYIYRDDLKIGRTRYRYLQLQHAISEVSVAIFRGKDEYKGRLVQKLKGPSANSKTF